MVLPRDAREDLAHLLLVDPVLLAVTGRAHREHRGRGERAAGAVGRRLGRTDEALVAAVLDLLDTDRDVFLLHAGRRERLLGRVDQQVVGALVPVFAEGRAAHPDDRDLVFDAVRTHERVSP